MARWERSALTDSSAVSGLNTTTGQTLSEIRQSGSGAAHVARLAEKMSQHNPTAV